MRRREDYSTKDFAAPLELLPPQSGREETWLEDRVLTGTLQNVRAEQLNKQEVKLGVSSQASKNCVPIPGRKQTEAQAQFCYLSPLISRSKATMIEQGVGRRKVKSTCDASEKTGS